MDGAPSPSVDRSQVEDRSTAIDVTVSGLKLPGFRFDRVIGYYAIAANKAAKNAGRQVDLLVLVDPELRSNLTVPSNVEMAVNISDEAGFLGGKAKNGAVASAPATTMINLAISNAGGHGKVDELVSGFVAELAILAEEGNLNSAEVDATIDKFNKDQEASGSKVRLWKK